MSITAKYHQPHPEIVERSDALLCSINERLAGGAGQNFAPITRGWMSDYVALHEFENPPEKETDDEEEE